MTDVIDMDVVVSSLLSWVEGLGAWPTESPDQIGRDVDEHGQGDARYGVCAFMLTLVSGNLNRWPPITPHEFCRQAELDSERFREQLFRRVLVVVGHELRNEVRR